MLAQETRPERMRILNDLVWYAGTPLFLVVMVTHVCGLVRYANEFAIHMGVALAYHPDSRRSLVVCTDPERLLSSYPACFQISVLVRHRRLWSFAPSLQWWDRGHFELCLREWDSSQHLGHHS
jgi:hypothetical protein